MGSYATSTFFASVLKRSPLSCTTVMVTAPVLLVWMSLTIPDFPACEPAITRHRAPSARRLCGLGCIVHSTITRSPALRPNVSGAYISSAFAGGTTNEPGVVARAT